MYNSYYFLLISSASVRSIQFLSFIVSMKEMETHSIVLAWRILGTGKPGGLPSIGSHRVGHD